MYALDWIIANKELLKIAYGLVIGIICLIIVMKTHKLYHFSHHEGIRYFRNAFMFYGIAFIVRYILGGITIFGYIDPDFYQIVKILFDFFLVMGGFFLLYSLLWRKLVTSNRDGISSLISFRSFVFYGMALLIAILDYLWQGYYFMFFSQIILFAILSIMSYVNYRKDHGKNVFPKFYFIAMVLSFIAWLLNGIAPIYFNWSEAILMEIYGINILVFILFLYGVITITKKPRIK